ncbi:MAG: hypothetical protein ACOC0Q_10350, partial [Wenzhouxiangella sp.]
WGHVGLIGELRDRICRECFGDASPVVIATGGFSSLLAGTGLFDEIQPDLVLEGIRAAQALNE